MRFPGFEGEWRRRRLGEVGEIISGLTYSPNDVADDGVLVLRSSNVQRRRLAFVDNVFVKTGNFNPVLESDILICVRNGSQNLIGKNALIKKEHEGLAFGAFMTIYRSSYNDFLFHWFNTEEYKSEVYKNLGATINSINGSDLKRFKVPFPSEAEQKKIASFLSLLDERIATQNKIIDILETLIKGLNEKLLTQKIRFKDENGDDFPEWEENFGNSLFESISNKNHNSDLPILAITQERGAIPRDMIDYNVSVSDKSIESYKMVQKGDFIISLRSFQGGIEFSNYEGICSPAYIVLRPIKEVNRNFFRLYFKTSGYIKRLTKNLEGIRDGKMISFKYFSEVTILAPSIEEQAKIANFLISIDGKTEIERKILAQYESQKNYLLQSMFI